MKKLKCYGVLQMGQRPLSERAEAEQRRKTTSSINRRSPLGKAVCIALAVFLSAHSGSFAVPMDETFLQFRYEFGPETGYFLNSDDPIQNDIKFSRLTLNGVGKGGPFSVGYSEIGITEVSTFGPWYKPPFPSRPLTSSDSNVSFTISAPSGYELKGAGSWNLHLLPATPAGYEFFSPTPVSEYTASVQIRFAMFTSATPSQYNTISTSVPVGYLSGGLSIRPTSAAAVPESGSTLVFGGISAAGLMFLWLRSRRGAPSGPLA